MKNLGFRSRALAVLLLWLLPALAHADETALGPVKPEAVEFKPDRLFDPTVLLPIEVDGVWGYVDRRGNVVIAPQYDWVDYFYGPFTGARSRNTWFARYMSQGRMGWLIFYENKKRGKGLIQGNDLRVIQTGSDTQDRFYDGHSVRQHVSDSGLSYYLSKPGGKRLNQVHYTGALRMSDGYSAVQIDGLCGFIDKRGELVVPLEYAWVRSFREGVSAVRRSEGNGGEWGFIDKRGVFKFLAEADEIQDLRSYHDGLVAVKTQGKWGFLDRRQRPRTAPIYDEVRDFAGGCAAVRRGTEWGYINVNGEEIAWGFDGAWQFEDATQTGLQDGTNNIRAASLGLIRQGSGYGYVSQTGRVQIEPRFESALPFFRGVARVKCGESFAYIDSTGRPIWDPRRVTRFGIRGLQSPPPVKPKWPGLPRSAGANRTGGTGRAGGEPFPFEYDVPDYLPLDLKPTEGDGKKKKSDSSKSPSDSPPAPNDANNEKETSETGSADEKPKKRPRYVR